MTTQIEWENVENKLPDLPPKQCKGVIVLVRIKSRLSEFTEKGIYTYYGRFEIDGVDVHDYVTHWAYWPIFKEES